MSKSPIKDKPLRLPGQSLEEERRRLFEDRLETPFVLALCFTLIAALDWWRELADVAPSPRLFTVAAILLIAFTAWRFLNTVPRIRAIKQGIEGEKAVGQFLERLRADGYQVFHDVVGAGFNVDHVLIGPGGIYTIETKTWSKPARGEPRIKFDGEQITVAGREPERDPVIQARAQASWLKGLLTESTGRPYEVFPVVVFPGWYIEQGEGTLRNMWVLEPKALAKFLANAPQRLEPEAIKLASFHLSRFVRSSEQLRDKR